LAFASGAEPSSALYLTLMGPPEFWELLLRGCAVGALAATALGLWRGGEGPARAAGIIFCLTSIGYALNSSEFVRMQLGPLFLPSMVLSLGGAGTFWLFVRTVFEDQKITWPTLAPAGVLLVIGLIAVFVEDVRRNAFILHHIIQTFICVHALYLVARGWRGDLVEGRRRLRGPFFVIVGIYVMGVTVVEFSRELGHYPPWGPMTGAVSLAALCLSGAWVFLDARTFLFGAAQPAPAPVDNLDAGDRLLLARLNDLMDKEQAWRREGLTIGALAAELDTPEHRLRRLINDHLGARNFAAFVNTRRIAAAKALLADPANARKPVSAIAFDLGFGSLGPFNRAFKDETGVTPSEWRRNELENGSPIPENAG
jgi:AraC-like DNA-binding protein